MLRFLEKRKIQLVYFPLTIYWFILLAATSFPTESIPTMGVGDKFMHFAAYFVLGVLLNLTLMFQNKYTGLKKFSTLFTLIIGILYAIVDEVHQHFIPGRSMEFFDFVADLIGLLLAVILLLIVKKLSQFALKDI